MGLKMGLEEKIPSGFVLTTVEKLAGYMRKNSLWPATFGLACCAIEMMAVGSAAKGLALPSDLIALGEVGLAGEVRKVNGIQQRLNEAARLGFTRAIVPDLKGELKIPGMEILEVTRLTTALERVRLT